MRILKNNQRIALVRVEFKDRRNCRKAVRLWKCARGFALTVPSGAAAPTTEWFYSRDHSGRFVVSKKAAHDDQFGKNPEGGFAALVSKSVCSQMK